MASAIAMASLAIAASDTTTDTSMVELMLIILQRIPNILAAFDVLEAERKVDHGVWLLPASIL